MYKPHTLEILKNFAQINQSILFKEGNVLRTMSVRKTIFGVSPVGDEFTKQMAVYNLNEFLATINLFVDPTIKYENEYILIKDKHSSVKYYYSSPDLVTSPPTQPPEISGDDAKFSLSEDEFTQILKASSVMSLPYLFISNNGIEIKDKAGPGNMKSNSFSFDVEVSSTHEKFEHILKIEYLKMIVGSYDVFVDARGLVLFECKDENYPGLKYFVSLEANA